MGTLSRSSWGLKLIQVGLGGDMRNDPSADISHLLCLHANIAKEQYHSKLTANTSD